MQPTRNGALRVLLCGVRGVVLAAIGLLLAAGAAWAAERRPLDDPKFSDKSFATADKNDDGSLDEREMREAARIVRSALLGSFGNDVPGGKATKGRLEELVTKAKFDGDGDGKVSRKEYNQGLADIESRARAAVEAAAEKAREAAKKAKERREEVDKQRRKVQEKARREGRARATRKARRMAQ